MAKYMKYAGKALLFCVAFFALLVVASAVVEPKDCTKEAGMNNPESFAVVVEPENTIDAIVLGDSVSSMSIAPLEMYQEAGFTSYQCGHNAQRVSEADYMLRKAFETQKPKYVILEADTIFYNMSATRAALSIGMKYLPIISYHDRWKHLTATDFFSRPNYHTPNINKGYLPRDTWDYADIPADYMTAKTDPISIGKMESLFLRNLMDFAQENDCELVIVASPNPKVWTQGHHNEIARICQEEGLKFLDMNEPKILEEIGIDWNQDSPDYGGHLNTRGAMKVSSYLGNWLKENCDLPDHRDDPAYAQWNSDAADFQNRVDAMQFSYYDWSQEEAEVVRFA